MSDIGRTAYEAFYAGLPKDTWGPWEKERPDTQAIWTRIERAVRADTEAEITDLRARLTEMSRRVMVAEPDCVKLREALTRFCSSVEGVIVPFTDEQEAAYEAAARCLDDLSPDPA